MDKLNLNYKGHDFRALVDFAANGKVYVSFPRGFRGDQMNTLTADVRRLPDLDAVGRALVRSGRATSFTPTV